MTLTSKIKVSILIAVGMTGIGAPIHARIDIIDFKYTSLAYTGVPGAIAHVSFDVPTAVDMVGDFLRSGGASVDKLEPERVRIYQTEADTVCERWVHDVYRQEWAAFDRNNHKEYKRIDRTAPPECELPKGSWMQYGYTVDRFSADEGEGYHMIATLDRSVNRTQNVMRPAYTAILGPISSANMWSMVPGTVSSTLPFESVLEVFIWRKRGEEMTSIAVIGLPKWGSLAAAPGNLIGFQLRRLGDGQLEAAAARNLLTYMSQKAIKIDAEK